MQSTAFLVPVQEIAMMLGVLTLVDGVQLGLHLPQHVVKQLASGVVNSLVQNVSAMVAKGVLVDVTATGALALVRRNTGTEVAVLVAKAVEME